MIAKIGPLSIYKSHSYFLFRKGYLFGSEGAQVSRISLRRIPVGKQISNWARELLLGKTNTTPSGGYKNEKANENDRYVYHCGELFDALLNSSSQRL